MGERLESVSYRDAMPRCIEKMSAFQAKALFYFPRLKHSPAYNMYEQLVPEERMYYFFQQRKKGKIITSIYLSTYVYNMIYK